MTQTPASSALLAEVRKKVRERGVVLWIDAEGQYEPFVDTLARAGDDFTYPVVRLRGSFLELMLALEQYGNGLQPEHLLVHLPGLNKETIKQTPVYELYKAGTVFEKSLPTLVREAAIGVARPDEVEGFVRAPGLDLEKADAWLEALRAEPRDRLSLLCESLGVYDVALGVIAEDPRIRAHLPDGGERLFDFLGKGLGIDAAWRTRWIGDGELGSANLATLLASWLMAVEFVHDLKEPAVMPELRPLGKLQSPVVNECRRVARRFREQHPDAYETLAEEFQARLGEERTSHHAGALGSIDTFRFEESSIRAAAIGALQRREWSGALELARTRTPEECFWVRRSVPLQRTWELLRLAASAGMALSRTEKVLRGAQSLDEAVERYAEQVAPVDREHRVFEQRAHAVLAPDLPDHAALLDVRSTLRAAYREWADGINREFSALCTTLGPLPSASLRQRAIYDDVVHPLLQQGVRVAYFMVDALRFEMAQALAEELAREKYRVQLRARLAELPTITAVGMNALAPVQRQGRLRPALENGNPMGFSSNGSAVCVPADRLEAMRHRSLTQPPVDIELNDFKELSLAALKQRLRGKSDLVVVRSRELDTAGEHGLHLGTFDQTLALLRSALSLLAHAGVTTFVIASDHGFLLQDATVENVPFGVSMRVPKRRHALLTEPSGMPDVLEVRLSALDYDVDDDRYLVFRPDTAGWKTQEQVSPFVHGGNSLQERVIPVLVLEKPDARGKTSSRYEVVARAEPAHLGRQRLRVAVRLQQESSATLAFHGPRTINLALRVPGRDDIQIALLDVGPPGTLVDGRIAIPPNRDEAPVEFELEGTVDEKIRVEVFHPDAVEEVKPKIVDGFFDVARNRRLGKQSGGERGAPPSAPPERTAAPSAAPSWAELITHAGYRKVVEIVAERRTINEAELATVLGSPRLVRAFAREFDKLRPLLPFDVEITTVSGMKAYTRKD